MLGWLSRAVSQRAVGIEDPISHDDDAVVGGNVSTKRLAHWIGFGAPLRNGTATQV